MQNKSSVRRRNGHFTGTLNLIFVKIFIHIIEFKFSKFLEVLKFTFEIRGALRVHPAETRLTVYRRLSVLSFQENDKSRNFGAKMNNA